MEAEEKAQLGAAAAELLKLLSDRGFDMNQSCRILLGVTAALITEGCREDKVCLEDTVERFSKLLGEMARDASTKPKNVTASKMAFDAHIKHSRELIDGMLKEEEDSGYSPMMVKFPEKKGCRGCSARKGTFHTSIVRKRLDDRTVTLWAIVTLCGECVEKPDVQAKLVGMLTE